MQIINSEAIKPFDCDGCLIVDSSESDVIIEVVDPVTGGTIEVGLNLSMVRLLEEEFQRGSFIVVWSRSGWEWAKNIIEAAELTNKVHLVMSKPLVYFDDTPVENWLKDRVFIGPDVPYKR